MRGDEQADQRARRIGRAAQRVDHRHQAEAAPGLAQIAEPGAQPDDRLRVEAGIEDQLVELVVLGRPHRTSAIARSISGRAGKDRLDVGLGADLDAEFVDVADARRRARSEIPRAPGSRNSRAPAPPSDSGISAAAAIDLEPQLRGRVAARREMRTSRSSSSARLAQAEDVGCAFLRRGAGAIAIGKTVDVGQRKPRRAGRAGSSTSSASTAGDQPRTISTTAASSASASGSGALASIYCV